MNPYDVQLVQISDAHETHGFYVWTLDNTRGVPYCRYCSIDWKNPLRTKACPLAVRP